MTDFRRDMEKFRENFVGGLTAIILAGVISLPLTLGFAYSLNRGIQKLPVVIPAECKEPLFEDQQYKKTILYCRGDSGNYLAFERLGAVINNTGKSGDPYMYLGYEQIGKLEPYQYKK